MPTSILSYICLAIKNQKPLLEQARSSRQENYSRVSICIHCSSDNWSAERETASVIKSYLTKATVAFKLLLPVIDRSLKIKPR